MEFKITLIDKEPCDVNIAVVENCLLVLLKI